MAVPPFSRWECRSGHTQSVHDYVVRGAKVTRRLYIASNPVPLHHRAGVGNPTTHPPPHHHHHHHHNHRHQRTSPLLRERALVEGVIHTMVVIAHS